MQKLLLSEIASILPGYPFRGSIVPVPNGGVRALQMRDVGKLGDIDWTELVETEVKGRRSPDWLQDGDIVFAAKGARNYSIHLQSPPEGVVLSPHFFLVRLMSRQILPEFLAWQMNQAPAKKYFQAASEGSTTVSIRKSVLAGLPITIPPMATQQAIVQMVNCLNEQQHTIHTLEQNQQKLMAAIANKVFNSSLMGEGEQE